MVLKGEYLMIDKVINVFFYPWRILTGWWPDWLRKYLAVALFAWVILLSPMRNTNFDPWIWNENLWVRDFFVILWFVIFYVTDGGKLIPKIRWRLWVLVPALLFCAYLTANEWYVPKTSEKVQGITYMVILLCAAVASASISARRRLWGVVCLGIKCAFIITVAFCIYCRPILEDYRYLGMYSNPNHLGIFMVLVIAVILYGIDRAVSDESISVISAVRLLGNIILLAIANSLLYLSQARTSLAAWAAVIIIWILYHFIYTKGKLKATGQILLIAAFCSLATVLVFPAFYKVLDTVPDLYGKPITFDSDIYKRPEEKKEVNWKYGNYLLSNGDRLFFPSDLRQKNTKWVEEASEPETESEDEANWWQGKKTLTRIFTETANLTTFGGRTSVWKCYYEGLSWEGHENTLIKTEKKTWYGAHNNILQYGYMYGIASMPLYILLVLVIFIACLGYPLLNTMRSKEGLLFCLTLVGFFVITLMEVQQFNVYHVFVFPFWLLVGSLSVKVEDRVQIRKKTE